MIGDVAQRVERLLRMQEAGGSNPPISTKHSPSAIYKHFDNHQQSCYRYVTMATIRKRGKTWCIDYRVSGKRRVKAIGPYKEMAKLALADIQLKIARNRAGLELIDRKLSEYIPQFLSYIKAHSKPLTLRKYMGICENFTNFLDTLEDPPAKLSQISPSIIEQYKLYRLNAVKPQTVSNELNCLHHFFRYAMNMKYIPSNPTQDIKKIRPIKKKVPRFLTEEEITRLTSQCSPRLRDITTVLVNTGLRWGELQNLEWNDIDWNEKMIHIRVKENWSPKGDERRIPMNKPVQETLRSLPNRSNWVFTTSTGNHVRQQGTWTAFKKACQRAGLENVTLHTLRHTFASHLVMAGVDLATVSKLLGHKDISTTMIYSHLSPDHLRQAVEKLSS